jgi:transcriptional regulator GlxA family with amidase domain
MSGAPRGVGLVAFPGVQVLNIAGPMEMLRGAWSAVRERRPGSFTEPPYKTFLIARAAEPLASSCGLQLVADRSFREAPEVDTLIVAGGEVENALGDPDLMAFVRERAPRARRVVALGAGTFILARAGLLEGRRATTHWRHCEPLAKEYPGVKVERDLVFVKDGNLYTGAGTSAAMDLVAALIEEDHGRDVALAVARDKVMSMKRPGDEPQVSAHLTAQSVTHPLLAPLLDWLVRSPGEDVSVERLAERAAMSPRTLTRLFRQELNTSPAKFVEHARVEMARRLIEESNLRLDAIARRCGFGSEDRLRRTFRRVFGVSPRDYKRTAST